MTTSTFANYPYPLTDRERLNLSKTIDHTQLNSIPEMWSVLAAKCGDVVALSSPHAKVPVSYTYSELNTEIQLFATGLQALGVQPRTGVAIFADNSPRWLVVDQGTMLAGAFNAVRGAQAETQELLSILENSGATALIVEDLKLLKRLSGDIPRRQIDLVILLSDESGSELDTPLKVVNFTEVVELGKNHPFTPTALTKSDLATLIYTSGTSGNPKGVMLSHGNLLHQVNTCGAVIPGHLGLRVLSILPSWHCYERSCEYYLLSQGCTQTYTNIRYFKQDLQEYRPECMVAVPRLWESIYEGIQKQFKEQSPGKQKLVNTLLDLSQKYVLARRLVNGLSLECLEPSVSQRLKAQIEMVTLAPIHAIADKLVYAKIRSATGGSIDKIISGGGSLAKHLDLFFEIVGIDILVGYGLTETAPITNVRRSWRNMRLSSGQPLPGTEIQIVDLETRQPLPTGQKGLILIRGPQVMSGYYRDPEATAKAIDSQGWFNSGDLGMVTAQNDLVITGRAKDTIVLNNGENIEPQPIEDACIRSQYISQIVLVGQDQKSLGALIVPDLEALKQANLSVDLTDPQTLNLFRDELSREVKNRPGYRSDDRITTFKLLTEPFSIENGLLTQTLKIRRPVVMDRYHGMINEMFQ